MSPAKTLAALEAGTLDAARFTHRDHVLTAWEVLRQDEFFAAAHRYASAIRRLAVSAGVPGKFSATVTFAFLSLIAERMATSPDSAKEFLADNPDLLWPDVLTQLYSAERLETDLGRRVALLPDRASTGTAPAAHSS
ncbi:hypothetical protein OEZ71_15915 [Defluviimonas sp. WL0050]|uniref:Uncharacterized protein n=1 Tax=Albidovulum litorale TaxID=2984134 RepID=A0ABT2ZRK0_9RHOB|nr:hypothetical protein [Defluviimonas sp. WL0050]MCV2873785.1 hypothetical protein [Defluviimonas sp. WL0050]